MLQRLHILPAKKVFFAVFHQEFDAEATKQAANTDIYGDDYKTPGLFLFEPDDADIVDAHQLGPFEVNDLFVQQPLAE